MNLVEISQKQVVIINVGMSTKDGIPGPLFKDGTFKYVPIPGRKYLSTTPTYRDLRLAKWVPNPNDYVHHDPEFETFTFGDYEYKNGKINLRVANARKLQPKDFLFFFASLSDEKDCRRKRTTGFFLIGYFEIDSIIPYSEAKSSPLTRNNAHVKRKDDSDYTVWKGTKRSTLLQYAVPMNKVSLNTYLRTSKGLKLPWGSFDKRGHKRTNLEVINSATRSSRLLQSKFREKFWSSVLEKNPDIPILRR